MDTNYPMHNETIVDENGRRWMTVEELEYDAYLLEKVKNWFWGFRQIKFRPIALYGAYSGGIWDLHCFWFQ